jgi:spermidine/putrescine transport system ATP-binding protein
MRDIHIKKLKKVLNGVTILDNLSLDIPAGKFFALLGPSGCGKTTLLRLIAGLETPDEGHILLGKDDITTTPIHRRPINVVFQNYALFPHMNVFDNSLRIQKKDKATIEEKVHKILLSFHLDHHIHKYPQQLSGGQQQRVAIARAIISEPDVLLLDEPLAALDFKLREKMLLELIELQDKLKTTFIYVTHDQMEALTVADQMAIMNHKGKIEQIGRPKDIYEFPHTSFVARFVGTTNIFSGNLFNVDKEPYVQVEGLGPLSVAIAERKKWMQDEAPVLFSIRPEKIYISTSPVENFSNTLSGYVHAIVYHGRSTQYNVVLPNGLRIQVFEQNEDHFQSQAIDYDQKVYLSWQKENVVLLEQ